MLLEEEGISKEERESIDHAQNYIEHGYTRWERDGYSQKRFDAVLSKEGSYLKAGISQYKGSRDWSPEFRFGGEDVER